MTRGLLLEAKRQKVLVVEDDPSVRNLMKVYLEDLGVDSDEAADGRAAIASLKRQVPDLLCLDLMLPESSGYDVCELVRSTEELKHLPILIVSARTLPSDRAFAEEVGASAFLTKPFSRAEFLGCVRQMLNGKV